MRRAPFLLLSLVLILSGCGPSQPHITIGSKFFTEQVILAELLAQHIEARTGIHVNRKSNLGGTLLCQKALLSGDLDLYVEYTGSHLDKFITGKWLSGRGVPYLVVAFRILPQ